MYTIKELQPYFPFPHVSCVALDDNHISIRIWAGHFLNRLCPPPTCPYAPLSTFTLCAHKICSQRSTLEALIRYSTLESPCTGGSRKIVSKVSTNDLWLTRVLIAHGSSKMECKPSNLTGSQDFFPSMWLPKSNTSSRVPWTGAFWGHPGTSRTAPLWTSEVCCSAVVV